jgi:protein-S-isoprenylcysteine O-methyltransferase Ste14
VPLVTDRSEAWVGLRPDRGRWTLVWALVVDRSYAELSSVSDKGMHHGTMAKATLGAVGLGVILALALFVSAGRLSWPMAWAFLAFYVPLSAAGFLALPTDLQMERSRLPPAARPADLVLATLAFVFLLPATLIVCGLDVRLHWSPSLPAATQLLALVIFGLGYGFSFWAARSNPFFSTVVRIQRERGHHVIATGPYAYIRHPGYTGSMVGHLFLPVALGSFWALVPAVCGCMVLVLRTRYEERTLEEDLPGYREYALRVRWRFIPSFW